MKNLMAIAVAAFCAGFGVSAALAGTVYVGTENAADDAEHGTSADKPFASISYAVNSLVPDGGTVYVADGTYTEKNKYCSIIITNAISVIGSSADPKKVIIKSSYTGGSTAARIFGINHADARVRYVTMQNGRSYNSKKDLGGFMYTMSACGGNVWIGPLGGTVEDCIITGGHTGKGSGSNICGTPNGGNCYVAAGRIARCEISYGRVETSDNSVGAECLSGSAVMENCTIHHETARGTGGAVMISGGKLINCTIAENSGDGSSGVFLSGSNGSVINCIISANTLTGSVSETNAVYCLSYDSKKKATSSTSQFVNCLADSIKINDTCYTGAPAFKLETTGDYRIAASSAALDRGSDYASTGATSTTDAYGQPRLVDAVDIGASENQKNEMEIDLTSSAEVYIVNRPVVFTAVVTGASGSFDYGWDFDGDGTVDETTTTNAIAHAYTLGGDYNAQVFVPADKTGATKKLATHISPLILYVNVKCTTGAAPYDSLETAAKDIQTAIDYANDGATILVSPGKYTRYEQISISKALKVVGTGATPWATVLNSTASAHSANGRAAYLNHAESLLANVAMADCNPDAVPGGGVMIGSLGGTVSNCVIHTCRNRNVVGYAAGAYLVAGLITHSVVSNCYLSTTANLVDSFRSSIHLYGASKASNCLIVNCRSKIFGGARSLVGLEDTSVMENCTIVDCDVKDDLPAITVGASATMRNCVIAGMVTTNGTAAAIYTESRADRYENCATDGEEPINDTCRVAPAAKLFVDYSAADYTPAKCSVLKGHGATPAILPAVDLAGNQRVYGRKIDIGAFESQVPGPGIKFILR